MFPRGEEDVRADSVQLVLPKQDSGTSQINPTQSERRWVTLFNNQKTDQLKDLANPCS